MFEWLAHNYEWLFSGIGAALLLPLIALFWKWRQKLWEGLSLYVFKHVKNTGRNITIFGYIVSENNGQEDLILVQDVASIPYIKTVFVQNQSNLENYLYDAVSELLKKAELGIDNILEHGALPITYIKPYKIDWHNESTTSRTCIFFKLRIDNLENLSLKNNQYRLKSKKPVAQAWRINKFRFVTEFDRSKLIEDDPYRIVLDEYVTHEYGKVFLNCVDVLIFTQIDGEFKFLMIQRESDGRWEYQKAGLHYHETPLEGAYRIAWEEAGLAFSDLAYHMCLGFQTPDVSDRGKYYNNMRVHGFTFYYTGDPQKIKLSPSHKNFKWETLTVAREDIKFLDKRGDGGYGPIFFNRWLTWEREIRQKIDLPK